MGEDEEYLTDIDEMSNETEEEASPSRPVVAASTKPAQRSAAPAAGYTFPAGSILGGTILGLAGGNELTATQRAEIEVLVKAGLDVDDSAWLSILPVYLAMPRGETQKIDTEAAKSGSPFKPVDQDVDALAERVAARIVQAAPEIDAPALASRLNKGMLPAFKSAVTEAFNDAAGNLATAIGKAPAAAPVVDGKVIKEAAVDALVNRHLIIAALAGVLMTGIGFWAGGWQAGRQYEPVIQVLKKQVQDFSNKRKE